MANKKMDQLKESVKFNEMDEQKETEAVRSRMSKSKYKSGLRGPRDYKLTIPVPSSLNEDFREVCGLLKLSPTDQINEYLEKFVKENSGLLETVRKARENYEAQDPEE